VERSGSRGVPVRIARQCEAEEKRGESEHMRVEET
jgi:hypothetical protein